MNAERIYQSIVAEDPRHADAWQFLGVIAHQRACNLQAVEHIRRAIAIDPRRAQFHTNLGLVYKALDKVEDAAACFRRSLELKPDNAVAYNNLGVIRLEQQRGEEAAFCFRESRRLNDRDPAVYCNIGKSLRLQGKIEQAIKQFEQALEIDVEHVEAHFRLGLAVRDCGDIDRAVAEFERVLSIAPDHADALNSLGAALVQSDRPRDAEARLRRAITIAPEHASAHNNLGLALMNDGRLDEAEDALRTALRIKPDFPSAKSNLGALLLQRGELDQAIAALEDALRIDPEIVDAHWNRALALLARGEFREGWLEYEWRWLKPGRRRKLPRPLWDGSPLDGKTILLHAEQGLGDTFQFVRYAAFVSRRGGRVLLACQKPLVPLLSAGTEVDQVVAQTPELPAFDVHAPLMSLPGILRTSMDTIPARVPYIRADARLIEYWHNQLATMDGFKIGIAWQGNTDYRSDRTRSIPLAAFRHLAAVEGVRLISLQKGRGTEQIEEIRDRFDLFCPDEVDEDRGPFMDTAAIMKNLDLVVTSDTAIPHLAGALGVPVWMALSAAPDWRWMYRGDRSPWYPTMRLFRQRKLGDWDGVFERMAEELRRALQVTPGERPSPTGKTGARSLDPALPVSVRKETFIGDLLEPRNPAEGLFDAHAWAALGDVLGFSDRELSVAMLMMEGHSRAAMGRRLCRPDGESLSCETVRVYVERVFKKAGVRSKLELALRLVRIARELDGN